MSLSTKYALLKKKYEEVLQEAEALAAENRAMRQHLDVVSSSRLEDTPYVEVEIQTVPSTREIEEEEALLRKAMGRSSISKSGSNNTGGFVTSEADRLERVREQALERERQNQVSHARTLILTQQLRNAYMQSRSMAQVELQDLISSWQYRAHFFCHCGLRNPGFLVVLLHSLVFIPVSDQGRSVDVSFAEVRGVVRTEDLSPSMHLLLPSSASVDSSILYPATGATSTSSSLSTPSSSTHSLSVPFSPLPDGLTVSLPFWGFESFARDTQTLVNAIIRSRIRPASSVDEQQGASSPLTLLSSSSSATAMPSRQITTSSTGVAEPHRFGVSSPRLTAATPHSRVRIVIETYEHERYLTSILGWSSSYLLPSDPPKWSDRHGKEIQDPDRIAVEAPRSWRFVSDWDIDNGVIGVVERVMMNSQASACGVVEGDVVTSFVNSDHVIEANDPHSLALSAVAPAHSASATSTTSGTSSRAINTTTRSSVSAQDNKVEEESDDEDLVWPGTEFQTRKQLEAGVRAHPDSSVLLNVFRPSWNASLSLLVGPASKDDYPSHTLTGVVVGIKFVDAAALQVLKGWQYACSFRGDTYRQRPHSDTIVRRRRWTREVEVDAEDLPQMYHICAVSRVGGTVEQLASGPALVLDNYTSDPQPSLVAHTMAGAAKSVLKQLH